MVVKVRLKNDEKLPGESSVIERGIPIFPAWRILPNFSPYIQSNVNENTAIPKVALHFTNGFYFLGPHSIP